jgi:hypothetical protein
MALALPGVEEGTSYGLPALKVNGELLLCIPTNKSAEPDSIVARVDFDQRAELLETDPEVYYLKDHYLNYPCVLVRLSRIHPDALRDLIGTAWRFVTTKKKRPKKRQPRRR